MKIVHDIHTHNVFSHCCTDRSASTEAFIAKQVELGNRVFGLSNHIWDERVKGSSYWYRHQTISLAEEAKTALKQAPEGLRCLFGAETDFFACKGILGMSAEGASHFDYMLVPHSHIGNRNNVMADYPEIIEVREMIRARIREACPFLEEDTLMAMTHYDVLKEANLMKYVPEMKTNVGDFIARCAVDNFHALMENEEFIKICGTVPTIVAHPFELIGRTPEIRNGYMRFLRDEDLVSCFTEAKKRNAYVEISACSVQINGMDLSCNEMMRVYAIAKQVGCQFTFGSDSHSVGGLKRIEIVNDVCDYLGLTREDVAPFLAEDGVID